MKRSTRRRLVRGFSYALAAGLLAWLLLAGKASLDRTYEWAWGSFFARGWPLLLRGLWFTLRLSLVSLLFALPLGVAVGLCRTARDPGARLLGFLYVEAIRGTPLLVQLMVWYFVIGVALGDALGFEGGLDSFQAAACALSCFAASYIAEIVRAGIQSIDRGQMEAARSLGLTHAQAMRTVVLPQALRRVLPPLASEFIALVKDSSLASVIGYEELAKRAQDVQGTYFQTFEVWIAAAALYLVVSVILSLGVRLLERALGGGVASGAIR
ncbi:MAG: amino acid ABC transporter permease [Planctomycetota bacterium]|nr:MAG: amino acid ABC transporter permease [Planctomycetota bacterium]